MKNSSEDILYIVMPAYNEEETITSVVEDWYSVLAFANKKSKLVIADNNSKDSTYQILKKLQKKYPQLDVIQSKIKGHGPTVINLYKYAIEHGADYIFQTDSDGQTNPKEFKCFWDLRKKYDAIIGQRTVRGDGKSRKLVENVLCKLLRFIYGVKLKDSNAPFRLMKSELVAKYISNFNDDYNLPNVMLTTYFTYYHENICFKEISFKPRQGGINSINLKKIFKIGFDSLKEFYTFKENMTHKKNLFNILVKYKSLLFYAFFGVLTTVINVAAYALCAHSFRLSTIVSTILAWIVAVLFAYFTNRKYVFESKSNKILKEIFSFIACRLLTGFLDLGIMYYFVDKLRYNDTLIKILSNIIVIVVNYVASKLIIFKKGK